MVSARVFTNVSIHRELPRSWIRGWLHTLLESLKIKPPQLYTDLIFAEFLVTILGVDKVVFQYVQTTTARRKADYLYASPKSFPWFVSDVTPSDFSYTIRALEQPELWAPKTDSDEGQVGALESETSAGSEALKELARRFQERIQSGQFELSVGHDTPLGMLSALKRGASIYDESKRNANYSLGATSDAQFEFWTEPYAYHHMEEIAPKLWEYLHGSTLVIFKGDLKSVTVSPACIRSSLSL